MDNRKLIALAVVFGLLGLALIIKKASHQPENIVEEADLTQFVSDDVTTPDVKKIELHVGTKKDDKVVLVRAEDGWKVESLYNVRGDTKKIDGLIDKIRKMKGEFRADNTGNADALSDYLLSDDEALHCVLYGDEEKQILHILAGKASDPKSAFVRLDGENIVYSTPVDIRSEAGLWGESAEPPKHNHWMRKEILELDKEKIKKLAMTWPDKSLVFEKREKASPKSEETENKKVNDKFDDDTEDGMLPKPAEAKSEEKKEYEWKLTSGGIDGKFKQSGLDNILKELAPLEVGNAADPAEKKEFGLVSPGYRIDVTMDDGEKHAVVAGHLDLDGDGFLMLDDDPAIYARANWKFKKLFPKGSELIALEKIKAKADDIERIEIDAKPLKVAFQKKGDKWSFVGEDIGLKPKPDEAEEIAKSIAGWKPADYADGTDRKAFGLDKPWASISFIVKGGKKHSLLFGAESKVTEGRYTLADNGKIILTTDDYKVKRIKPELGRLFEMEVLDAKPAEITILEVVRKENPFKLTKKGNDWQLEAGGKTLAADAEKVDQALSKLSGLRATDIIARGEYAEPTATVKFTDKTGKTTKLTFCKEDVLRLENVKLDLKVDSFLLGSLAPKSETLVKPKPKEPAKAKPEEPAKAKPEEPAKAKPEEPAKDEPTAKK